MLYLVSIVSRFTLLVDVFRRHLWCKNDLILIQNKPLCLLLQLANYPLLLITSTLLSTYYSSIDFLHCCCSQQPTDIVVRTGTLFIRLDNSFAGPTPVTFLLSLNNFFLLICIGTDSITSTAAYVWIWLTFFVWGWRWYVRCHFALKRFLIHMGSLASAWCRVTHDWNSDLGTLGIYSSCHGRSSIKRSRLLQTLTVLVMIGKRCHMMLWWGLHAGTWSYRCADLLFIIGACVDDTVWRWSSSASDTRHLLGRLIRILVTPPVLAICIPRRLWSALTFQERLGCLAFSNASKVQIVCAAC